MRKTKLCTSSFLLVFLIFCTMPLFHLDSSTTYNNSLNLSADDSADSWSRKIKSGPQLYSSSMALIDNHTYILGSIGEYYTNDDIYIAKFDSLGVKLWEQIWGGSEYDVYKDYVIDSENNIYIVGITSNHFMGSGGNIFLLKYNTAGNLLWSRTIDPFNYNYFIFHSIEIDLSDSIFISSTGVSNYTNTKTFITKINSSGNIFWTEEIEIGFDPNDLKIQIDSVGNIYLYGDSYPNLFLLKLNTSGARQWYNEWGGRFRDAEMKVDLEDNIIVIGMSNYQEDHKNDLWIMKFNNTGNLTRKIICKSYERYHTPFSEVLFLENIFIFVESSLFEYNYSLDSQWNFTIGGPLQINGILGFTFAITSQHEAYFIYYTDGDINILKCNSSGDIIFNFKWEGSYFRSPPKAIVDSHGNLYMLWSIDDENFWKERIHISFLFKNPKSGDKPQIVPEIDDRTIFIFSLLGVVCVISVILLYNTLKPQSRSQLKTKSKVAF